jgi:membrane protease YdiL (CAAX protease family)
MSFAPHQVVIATAQLLMLLIGAWLIARTLAVRELRVAVLGHNRIPTWPLSGFEATLLALGIFVCGTIGQGAAVQIFHQFFAEAPDRSGIQVVLFGLGFHGIALVGWPLFQAGRRYAHSDYGAPPPPSPKARRLGWRALLWQSVLTLLLALPLLTLASAAWTALLELLGIEAKPQDLIGVIGAVESPAVLIAILLVACVLAPINEELLFRGVVFRAVRQRLGRGIALTASGLIFGAMHFNLAGFVPLALLGVILALAYEHSGDIRVPIVAHALFNLNTMIVVLSGLPGT